MPAALKLVVSVAEPELNVAVPSVVVPLLKVTVPVAAVGVTLAVSTVFAPTPTGLTDEVNVVVVLVSALAVPAQRLRQQMRTKAKKCVARVRAPDCVVLCMAGSLIAHRSPAAAGSGC